jgi:hypothetical protein
MFDNDNPRIEDIVARCLRAEAEGGMIDAATYARDIRYLVNRGDCAEGMCDAMEAALEDERRGVRLLNTILPWRAWGPG